MQKNILLLITGLLLSLPANAADRDCAQYQSSEALSVTSEDSTNTASFVFSGMTERKGTANTDCAQNSGGSSNTNENPTEEVFCAYGGVWDGTKCVAHQGGGGNMGGNFEWSEDW